MFLGSAFWNVPWSLVFSLFADKSAETEVGGVRTQSSKITFNTTKKNPTHRTLSLRASSSQNAISRLVSLFHSTATICRISPVCASAYEIIRSFFFASAKHMKADRGGFGGPAFSIDVSSRAEAETLS